MAKSTISMAIFNSYVSHYQRVSGLRFPQTPGPALVEDQAKGFASTLSRRKILQLLGEILKVWI